MSSTTNPTDGKTIGFILFHSLRPDILGPEVSGSSNGAATATLCKLYNELNTSVIKCSTQGPGHNVGHAQRSSPLLHLRELPALVRGTRSMVGDHSNAVAPEMSPEVSNSSKGRQISTSQIVAAPKRPIRFPTSIPLESIALPSYLKAVTSIPDEVGGFPDRLLPELLTPLQSSVTTRAGQTASLTCYVRNLGNRQVGGHDDVWGGSALRNSFSMCNHPLEQRIRPCKYEEI